MIPQNYQFAMDAGVYLLGVDSSEIGTRMPFDRGEIGDPAVFLIMGQSNGGNHGETRHQSEGRVFNFNPFDGLFYRASDPLLGATGTGGSPWCLLGDHLIKAGFARSVLFLPLCVGGATIKEWAPGGPYHHRMTFSIGRLRDAGLSPSHVLWHQGEADVLCGSSADEYVKSFWSLVDSLRRFNIDAPIYVATATFFAIPKGYEARQMVIRKAQTSLIDPNRGIFRGPDTDLIRDRFDGCHLGDRGLRDHARAWAKALIPSLSTDSELAPGALDTE